jgi:hypothetical protein
VRNGISLLDADMKLVLLFRSLVAIQSTWVLTRSVLLQVARSTMSSVVDIADCGGAM